MDTCVIWQYIWKYIKNTLKIHQKYIKLREDELNILALIYIYLNNPNKDKNRRNMLLKILTGTPF